MKIAFILGAFPTLSETFILNQITGLIDRGHEVDIYPRRCGDTSRMHQDVMEYELLNRAYYTPLPKSKILRILKGIFLLLTNLRKGPLVLLRSLNVFKYGRQAVSLRLLYLTIPFIQRKCSYDIIHCHFGSNGLTGVRMRNIGAFQGKLVTTFHGYDVNVLPRLHGNGYYKELFQEVDLFTISSDFIGQRVKLLGADDGKLVKLPIGVNTCRFSTKNYDVDSNRETTILTVGRLVKVKGIEYSIRAVAEVLQKFPNIQYEIAGDGPLRGKLKNLTKQLGISGHVRFLGAKTRDQIIKLYSKAHIFMLSSIRNQNGSEEGQGLVLLEAQSVGLPVVATRVGGIPESVVDGKSGFLVPERDVDALAEKLIYLIEHPEIWPEMGRAGRAFVEINYDINKLNDRLVEIYQQLLHT